MRRRDRKIPLADGDEQDALTGWRKVIRFAYQTRAMIKRGYRRRVRRGSRAEIEGAEAPCAYCDNEETSEREHEDRGWD